MQGSTEKGYMGIIKYDSKYYWQSVELRSKVLRIPLGLEFTAEQLKAERDEFHFVYAENAEVKGCLVLKPVTSTIIEMKQIAVEPNFQKTGIGRNLILFCENYARKKGYRIIECHARKVAVGFYLKLDYVVEGNEFIEVTIPHFAMAKRL